MVWKHGEFADAACIYLRIALPHPALGWRSPRQNKVRADPETPAKTCRYGSSSDRKNLQMPHVSTYGSPFPIPRWDGGPPVKIKFAQTLKLQPRPADMVLVPQTGFLG